MVVVWHLTIWFCPPALLRHGYYAFLIVLVTCQYNRYLSVTTRIILYLQIIVVLLWHSVLAKSLNYKVSICFLPVTIRPGLSTTCTGVLKAVLSQVRMHQKLLTWNFLHNASHHRQGKLFTLSILIVITLLGLKSFTLRACHPLKQF